MYCKYVRILQSYYDIILKQSPYFYFGSVPIGVPSGTTGSMFTPIPTELMAEEAEVTGLDLLHKTKFTKLRQVEPLLDLPRVSEGITKLELMLDAVIKVRKQKIKRP